RRAGLLPRRPGLQNTTLTTTTIFFNLRRSHLLTAVTALGTAFFSIGDSMMEFTKPSNQYLLLDYNLDLD
uniref:Uncharacterized protein n=2 Tax=Oryza brachyantha TaxID=4533 RepID=J3NBD8_ORYBR